MGKFQIGDRVKRLNRPGAFGGVEPGAICIVTNISSGGGYIDVDDKNTFTLVDKTPYDANNFELVERYDENIERLQSELRLELVNGGENMELKDVKKENLKEAQKQFAEERKNAQIEFAKTQIRRATDKLDELDAQIKNLEESKKPYLEILEQFK